MACRRRIAILATLACAAVAAAQPQFRLGPDGTWVPAPAPAPGSDAAIMDQARRLLAEDKPGEAEELLDDWLEKNEHSTSPYVPRAYLLRGDARVADKDEFEALYDYEALCKGFPGSDEFPTAVEREVDIAIRYLNGYKRKWFGMRISSAEGIGEELLVRAHERMPGTRLAERADIELADYYYRDGDLDMATQAYEIFLRNYPKSQYRRHAMQRQVYSNIARFHGPLYDGQGLVEARDLIKDYNDMDPAGATKAGLTPALDARLEEALAAQALESARWYLTRDDWPSARFALRRLTRKYPSTAAAGVARDMMADRGWLPEPPEPAPEPAPAEGGG